MAKRLDKRRDPKIPEPIEVREMVVSTALIDRHSLQSRVRIDATTVQEYREDMQDGTEFPLPSLYTWEVPEGEEFERYYIGDGFHRIEADDREEIPALVHIYDTEEKAKIAAEWRSILSNTEHGLRRTQADRRRAVKLALERQPELNDNRLSKLLRVDAKTVARVRAEMEGRPDPYEKPETEPEAPAESPEGEDSPELREVKERALESLDTTPVPQERKEQLSPVVHAARALLIRIGHVGLADQTECRELVDLCERFVIRYDTSQS